jgi:hypothetical protein
LSSATSRSKVTAADVLRTNRVGEGQQSFGDAVAGTTKLPRLSLNTTTTAARPGLNVTGVSAWNRMELPLSGGGACEYDEECR